MSDPGLLEEVPGASALLEWFGFWPSFHDAEILGLELSRRGESCLRVHAFRMTNEVDERGFYRLDRDVVVTFLMSDIAELSLHGFNQQNVLSCSTLTRSDAGFRIELGDCYGLAGHLVARRLAIEFTPGKPSDAQ